MLFLLCCVFGGFRLHFYSSLLLDILLRKTYEKPIDTAQDILDRGFKIIKGPGSEATVWNEKNSPSDTVRKLAENTIIAKV